MGNSIPMKRKNKKNTRKIGEDKCNEVKELLEKVGYRMDGPFYKVQFVGRRMRKVHNDIFGCYDLISMNSEGHLMLHQVTSSNMKSNKEKKIRTLGGEGALWTYDLDKDKEDFRIFRVFPHKTTEFKLKGGRFEPI